MGAEMPTITRSTAIVVRVHKNKWQETKGKTKTWRTGGNAWQPLKRAKGGSPRCVCNGFFLRPSAGIL